MLAARHGTRDVLTEDWDNSSLDAQSDHTETVKALIDAGADISLRNEVRFYN